MLHTWQAQRLDHILTGGRTHPLVVECMRVPDDEDEDVEAIAAPPTALMVVKAAGLPEVTERTLFNEVFGNLLARRLGVETARPALVELSPAFVAAAKPILAREGLSIHAGFAAGCEYFQGGWAAVGPGQRLAAEEVTQAAAIYGFDLLVQNPDRRPEKPNCGLRSGRFVAFDFEMAFSFLLLIGSTVPPWCVNQLDIARNHLFHKALRGKTLDWQPFLSAVAELTDDELDSLARPLPESWRGSEARVRKHLADIREHLSEFAVELQGSLA